MISIAMATYNGAKYIGEQIDSILYQTVRDFELIICDDRSTDDTWKTLMDYQNRDKRIHIYKNEKNLGFRKNFEKAISLCKGDYIALSDQDDIWTTNHLEILLSIIDDKMLACGNTELIDAQGNKIGMTLKEMEAFDRIPKNDLERAYSVFFFRNPLQGASLLMRKEIVSLALPIAEGVLYHDTWFSMVSCFYGGGVYTDQIIGYYRMHGKNVTGNRIKRRSRVRCFIAQLLMESYLLDRKELIMGLERLGIVSPTFLYQAQKYVNRANTQWGRILNSLFRLKHYKVIYNCN